MFHTWNGDEGKKYEENNNKEWKISENNKWIALPKLIKEIKEKLK